MTRGIQEVVMPVCISAVLLAQAATSRSGNIEPYIVFAMIKLRMTIIDCCVV